MKLHFFGCSFTEGGGLDNFDYYNFITGKNYNINYNVQSEEEEIRMYKEENRYSSVVGNILGLEVKNYAKGANSNESILKSLFEVVNDEYTKEGDFFIVQPSFYARKFYWYEPTQEFVSVNASLTGDWPYRNREEWMPLHQLHNLNLTYCHNEEYEFSKLLNNMELYNSYFKEKNMKLFWTPWADLSNHTFPDILDADNIRHLEKYKNIILYENKSMGRYISDNGLLITDKFKQSNDTHKSVEGHRIIGEKIAEYLKEKL